MEAHDLKVTEAQIEREAELYLIGEYQRMGYGMPSPEMIKEYKPQMLQNENMVRSFHDAAADKLVLEMIKNTITLKEKKITLPLLYAFKNSNVISCTILSMSTSPIKIGFSNFIVLLL